MKAAVCTAGKSLLAVAMLVSAAAVAAITYQTSAVAATQATYYVAPER